LAGNIRELQSVIREALIVAAGTTLLPEFLASEIRTPVGKTTGATSEPPGPLGYPRWTGKPWRHRSTPFHEACPIYIGVRSTKSIAYSLRAIQQSGGQQNRAAEILGLSRVTLRAKMRALKMSVERVVTSRPDFGANG
jgi:two-component system nitrogen regulation response regulator GlnG